MCLVTTALDNTGLDSVLLTTIPPHLKDFPEGFLRTFMH